MQTIRTTVTLPTDLHEWLRLTSIKKKKSLGKLIAEKFLEGVVMEDTGILKQEIMADLVFFNKVAKSGKKVDLIKALRRERNRDG